MKIVYCLNTLAFHGGKERIVTMKANYLATHGYEVHIIQFNQHFFGFNRFFYILSPSVQVHDLKLDFEVSGNLYIQRFLQRKKKRQQHRIKYEQLLSDIRPDIVVTCEEAEQYRYLWRIKDGSKKVLEIHNNRYIRIRGVLMEKGWNFPALIKAWYQTVSYRYYAKRFDAFICLSHGDKPSWGHMKNLHIISNPITIDNIGQADTTQRRVIAVGRMDTEKQHDVLIRCWARIPLEIREGWTLDIYGEGRLKPQLQQLIEELNMQDSIHLQPWSKDITQEYLHSSIYCSTSLCEGFSLALCEAMSVGLPVVTFNHPHGASDMIQDESMGMLIPMGREDLFVEKLQQLMTDADLRKSMGAEARRSVYERYSMETIMQKWLSLFDELNTCL